ncbi:autotransporter assembly complex protein TamA [Ruixingdingia sedimenti]|uniref:Autotransporter assembly complex family protein n=1 Tax=Ruixingdingia sedimenti TaxID=3073604 RepID=A0ABU1F683_9RHOB|nr:autotransporter assembly complex family protein [Xinfangfangia sp. LG-4]MDR5652387.1 autotransporter assembly complex family protein [Xinfangfangia sp. LG-4]
MAGRERLVLACIAALAVATPAGALDPVGFDVRSADEDLTDDLRGASLVLQAEREKRLEPQDMFAAAQADYARLLGTLYAAGHYSGVINIRLDGREAAGIAPLNAPQSIGRVQITVDPGPRFTFGRAEVGPLAPETELPEDFVPGGVAYSDAIRAANEAAIDGWRHAGHAKAATVRQDIVADHGARRVDARLGLAPGPLVRFGHLSFSGSDNVRPARLHKIAGFPTGEVYDPEEVDRVADRLRRTGVFRSVALTENERLGPGATLDMQAALIEEAPRRIGAGVELASFEGLTLSGYWLHRNLLGGAERLRFDAEIAQIGGQRSGTDYSLGATYDRPATLTPDTTLNLRAKVGRLAEEDYTEDAGEIGFGFSHMFSNELTARAGLDYRYSVVRDSLGKTTFKNLRMPLGVLWDRRDSKTDATRGTYLDAELAPFVGFGTTDSGARLVADGRIYRALGERVVLAGRLQVGAVMGAAIARTSRDYLFYSGGGGTVRGQPYQSLGVNVLPGQRTGGTAFLGASVEARVKVTDRIGVVAFYDYGRVGADGFGGSADWHAGAGLGVRYATGIGPIRLDVGAPAGGNTGKGAQIYIGIGQAF